MSNQDYTLITKNNSTSFTRTTMPTSWKCEPMKPPEEGTPINVFVPSTGGFGEPFYLGLVEKRTTIEDVTEQDDQ